LSAFAGRDTGDDSRAVIDRELGMPGAEAAGDALNENLSIGFNEDGHEKVTISDLSRSLFFLFCQGAQYWECILIFFPSCRFFRYD